MITNYEYIISQWKIKDSISLVCDRGEKFLIDDLEEASVL